MTSLPVVQKVGYYYCRRYKSRCEATGDSLQTGLNGEPNSRREPIHRGLLDTLNPNINAYGLYNLIRTGDRGIPGDICSAENQIHLDATLE